MIDDDFLKLLLQRGNIIKRYLIRIGARPPDAEEIVQDTLLKGITHIDSIDPDKFLSWLFKVATHKYYDLFRKENRREKTLMTELFLLREEQSPEDRYLQMERSQGIKEALNRVPQRYKQMLILKYELDLSYEEIGRLLHLKPERVKTDLYRARNKFKKLYEGEWHNER